jgi:hypothetical protein
LAKLRPGTDESKTLFRKCADTLKANLPAWIQPACDAFGQPFRWKVGKSQPPEFAVLLGPTFGVPLSRVTFDRGLVREAEASLERVTDHAPVSALFAAHPITQVAVALPRTAEQTRGVLPPLLLPVRRLRVFGGMSPDNLDAAFSHPAFGNVCDFAAVAPIELERLIASPLAKRLTHLRTKAATSMVAPLEHFPLDDRLQEFSVAPYPPVGRIDNGEMTPAFWSHVSRVSFRPTLKRLDLTRCGMTDDGLAAFARGEEWVRLQGLKLGGNLFGDRGWADFCRGWRTPELTYLDASRNRLTDSGAEMLARSGMLKTLRVIDLRGNRIAGRGAVVLARAVAEGKLQKLLLAGNPLGKREAAQVKGLLGGRTDV